MNPIRLIRDKAELRGTCYFELLPGEYKEQCWNDGSVFLAEDVFGLIEPIIARYESRFDHWAFVAIRRATWEHITADLRRLAELSETSRAVGDLRGDVKFLFISTKSDFARDFQVNIAALACLARELADWVEMQLREHECISVLGI